MCHSIDSGTPTWTWVVSLGFSKFVVCFRVLTRRFSFNALKPSAEGSGRGEIHFCCNRRKGGITRGEQNLGLKHSCMFYPCHDALAADALNDRHKIMWRDAKLVGIETDLTLCTCVATYQYLELMEYFFATNAWWLRGPARTRSCLYCTHIIYDGALQMFYNILALRLVLTENTECLIDAHGVLMHIVIGVKDDGGVHIDCRQQDCAINRVLPLNA